MGLMPWTSSEAAGDTSGSEADGAGSSAVAAPPAGRLVSRLRPTTPSTMEPTAIPPPTCRKRRRSQSGIEPVGSVSPAAVLERARQAGAVAASMRRSATRARTMAATTVTTAQVSSINGRVTAARMPAPPAMTKPTSGTLKSRRPATPRMPAMRTEAMTMPALTASLSFVPNSATARSLPQSGWFSMTVSPMAMTSDGAPAMSPAISSPTAMASPAANPPAMKAATSAAREEAAPAGGGLASVALIPSYPSRRL